MNISDFTAPKSHLPAETVFLLNACRSLCAKDGGGLWEGVRYAKLDWNIIEREACTQGLGPLLYQACKRNSQREAPEHAVNAFRRSYYENLRMNIRLMNVLESLLGEFNTHMLSAIVFKGPLLARDVYPNGTLRTMSDIDILVKRQEAEEIDKVLNRLGYKSEPVRKWLLREYYCAEYYHKSETRLEIHWELLHPQDFSQTTSLIPAREVWETAAGISFGEHRAFAMSDEIHLLYLCLHMAKHFKEQVRLIWACDIALFLQKKQERLDWAYFWRLAEQSGQRELVSESIRFVEISIGEEGERAHEQSGRAFICLGRSPEPKEEELRSTRLLHRISRIPGLWHKIVSVSGYVFPNEETISWRYGVKGKQKILLLRLSHPVMLIWRGIHDIYYKKISKKWEMGS